MITDADKVIRVEIIASQWWSKINSHQRGLVSMVLKLLDRKMKAFGIIDQS